MDGSIERALRLREHVVLSPEQYPELRTQEEVVTEALARLESEDLTEGELRRLRSLVDNGLRANERLRLRAQRELEEL